MAGPLDDSDEAALWRRWRTAGATGAAVPADPDPLLLAAYAEDRLSVDGAEAVEDWLAANPLAAQDIVAARRTLRIPLPVAPSHVIDRAAALVGVADGVSVLAFRRPSPSRRHWREALRIGAMAASVLVASFVGFAMGNDTFVTLAGGSAPALSLELLDPPTGLFNELDEDSST
ncbi:MAG TPA: hypothetical protein VLX85_14220 [Stellaceae bacterium]|nr:hypothetical protein [Stellaceae bacterium]